VVTAPEPDLHEALVPLEWLIGTWWGFGVVGYPTIEGAMLVCHDP